VSLGQLIVWRPGAFDVHKRNKKRVLVVCCSIFIITKEAGYLIADSFSPNPTREGIYRQQIVPEPSPDEFSVSPGDSVPLARFLKSQPQGRLLS
jgi:hypothetical protein